MNRWEGPNAFDGVPMASCRDPIHKPTACPKCQGHGVWRYREAPLSPNQLCDTKIQCDNCYGEGWVRKGETHVHEWKCVSSDHVRCLSRYVCTICGVPRTVDSGD